jgi:hypothetical protein
MNCWESLQETSLIQKQFTTDLNPLFTLIQDRLIKHKHNIQYTLINTKEPVPSWL